VGQSREIMQKYSGIYGSKPMGARLRKSLEYDNLDYSDVSRRNKSVHVRNDSSGYLYRAQENTTTPLG